MADKPGPIDSGSKVLEFLNDVRLRVAVEFGRTKTDVKRLLSLQKNSVVELEKLAGEPLDIRMNGKLVARGEAVIVNDRFGVRVTEIVSPEGFDEAMINGESET